MCDPNSMATMNKIDSTLLMISEQNKLANDYNRQLEAGYRGSMVQLDTQRSQMADQNQQQMSLIAKQAQQAKARLAAQGLDSGLSGNSMTRLQNDIGFQQQDAQSNLQKNFNDQMAQSALSAEALRRQYQAQARTGSSWKGVQLMIDGIELQGRADNSRLTLAQDQMRQSKGTGYRPWPSN